MSVLVKQPAESREYRFDFTDLLASGETLSSVTSVTGSPSGLTIGTPAVDSGTFTRLNGATGAASTSAVVRISSGTDAIEYDLECIVVTSSSNTLECDGTMQVRD